MSQVNVNAPPPKPSDADRAAAARINLITVLMVLIVTLLICGFLLTEPARATRLSGLACHVLQPAS